MRTLWNGELDDAAPSWWTAYRPSPGRVEAGLAREIYASPRNISSVPQLLPSASGSVEAIICPDEWACFRQGYQDFGGRPEWEDRFVDVVIPCESEWQVDPAGRYLGLAQFAPDSWATAGVATGLTDYRNPYHQGANVAWWSNATDPGGSGGWAECWKRVVEP